MSWTMSIPATPTASLDKEVEDALSAGHDFTDKQLAQIKTAKRIIRNVAKDLMASETHTFISATAFGHAEPEHPNRDNYSPDYINVSVQCACRVGLKV